MLSYLARYVTEIREAYDIIAMFGKVQRGRNHLVKSLRKLFNLCEIIGYEKACLDSLRKALPKVEHGIDIKIPLDEKIIDSLKKLVVMDQKYHALYDLLLDSGLRLTEATELINSFNESNIVSINGFYRYELAMFRGCKQAYYGYFSKHTFSEIQQVKEKIDDKTASRLLGKHGFVRPKYLRKYAFDKMIELDIPESVADFIEGRVPRTIGAKHYLALARQSSNFYPRYAGHLESLRLKKQEKRGRD